MILFRFFVFFRYGSGVLDGQKRISSGVDECDKVGDGDEVDRASGYGGIVGERLPLVVESLDFRGLYLFDDGFCHVPDLMISLSSQYVIDLSRRETVVHLIG
ncbi:hypothetical protein ACFX10_037572 [Malus domestica]